MPTPLPAHWSDDEKRVFTHLVGGTAFDDRTAGERGAEPTAALHVRVSGQFLAEVIRQHMDKLPIGLQLQGVAVTGEVNIENVSVEKIVSLEHCFFDGPIIGRSSKFSTFSLSGSVLTGYLDMRACVFSGPVFLRHGLKSLTCVLLRDVSVTGPVDCQGATFKYNAAGIPADILADEECFGLARSSASALFWKEMQAPPAGIVSFRNCRIGSLRDDINDPDNVARDWPAPGKLRISGLKYDERTSTTAASLRAWIELQDPKESRYGSYQTAIKLLLDSGDELNANDLIVAKQRYIAHREQSVLNRWLRRLYILLSQAGIDTDRIAWITVAAFVVSWVGICIADRHGQFIPKSSDIVKDRCFVLANPCTQGWVEHHGHFRVPPYYPKFSSIGYAVDLFVPGISYGVAADWRPAHGWMTVVTLLIRAAGLLCTGLLVVCVSGIARFAR